MRVTFSSLSLRTPQPKKVKLNFSKTMFANEIVSFTISSISKSPTMASFLWSLVKDIQREKKSNHFRYTSVVSTQIWQTHFWQTTPSQKNTKHIFCSFHFYKQQAKKTYTCCKTWLHLFVFCKFSTCYKWTKWAKWAAILSELSPLSPLKTN